jgi:TetR/AcrR family transcriptional regulator, cholesterol catabolism regulator
MPPIESPKGAAKKARQAEVLAAAFEVFIERGYEAATIQEIASRVGLLKGSLYYYIESKETLLFALIIRPFDTIVNHLATNEELIRGDAITRLRRFIELFIGNISDNTTEAEGRLVQQEMHRLSQPHGREIRARAEIAESFLRDILEQGIADGDFDPETDSWVAGHSIFSILNKIWALRRVDKPWSEIVTDYLRFMVQGLGGDLRGPPACRSPLGLTLDRSRNFVHPANTVYN